MSIPKELFWTSQGKTVKSADQCLFISHKVTCLVVIDDTLSYSPTTTEIDKTLNLSREAEMDLN